MAHVDEREIEANGLVFETLLSGPSSGEAVVLLHGYPQSAESWRDTASWLGDEGYRAIAPSLRGYSPGANPRDPTSYAMAELIEDVLQIAGAEAVDRFHVVGHDWGGALAWMLAGAQPERLLSLTVLSTPHPAALRAALRSSTQMLRSGYMGLFRIPRIPETLLEFGGYAQLGIGARLSGLPGPAWERDRAQLERVGGLRGPLNWYRGTARAMGRAHRIAVPTLYVWGKHDLFLGGKAARLTENYVDGEYRFVELDAGHWLPDRNAEELHRLLGEHLGSHPAERPAPATATPRRTTRGSRAPAAPRVSGRSPSRGRQSRPPAR